MATPSSSPETQDRPISLKHLAEHLGLSSATVSIVINRKPLSEMIPESTKQRIWEAARRFNYRPNVIARSLRQQRTYSMGVLLPSSATATLLLVFSGIEDYLLQKGYAWLAASHRHKEELIREYPHMLYTRAVEGLITVDTPYNENLPFPVVSVSGHRNIAGVTNIVLNHERAAELAIGHLHKLRASADRFHQGADLQLRYRRSVAVDPQSLQEAGTGDGFQAYRAAGRHSPSPEMGYAAIKKILASQVPFTALFAFNDVSAIGAIRALQDSGKQYPNMSRWLDSTTFTARPSTSLR